MGSTVCWVAHRDPEHPRAGGAEKSLLEISNGLSRLGWTTNMISGGFPGSDRTGKLGPLNITRGSGSVLMHFELPALLRRSGPFDVVIEDLGHVAPFQAERTTSTPGVVFFRHLHRRTLPGQVGFPTGALLTLIERAYPTIFRRWPLVAPSPSAMADLHSLGFEASRLHLIPYGVDSETFRPGTLTERPSLIYFSGLRRYKRAAHALRVLAALQSGGMDVGLTVVGRGPELPKLEEMALALGISQDVKFTGWLPEAELASLVARSWLHIQCSTAEGWGLTASEAAASGVPTVAYRVPGLTDSVVDGVSGKLVEDGDVSALTKAAAEVLETRSGWTARTRRTVLGRSWASVATQWDSLLRQVK
jgi:glycosyltransferase involved in cell wall biosynthesis